MDYRNYPMHYFYVVQNRNLSVTLTFESLFKSRIFVYALVVMDTASTHGQLTTRPSVVVTTILGRAILDRVIKLYELGG